MAGQRARRVCKTQGCPTLIDHAGYCDNCARQADKDRGRRQQRGYDAAHDRLRQHWSPRVAMGAVHCARCSRPILPGQPWHLDHDDTRIGYIGPSHAYCNLAAGGLAAHSPRSAATTRDGE